MEFPQVFIINLPHRKDRLEAAKLQFSKWKSDFDYYAPTPIVKQKNKGVALSHRACAEEAKRRGLPWVIIIEDDCVFTETGATRFEALLPTLWERRADWDVFMGGPSFVEEGTTRLLQRDPPLFQIKGKASHFVLLNARIYDQLITDLTEEQPLIIDEYYMKKTIQWCTYPLVALQQKSYSDIAKIEADHMWLFQKTEEILAKILKGATGGRRKRRRTRRRFTKRR